MSCYNVVGIQRICRCWTRREHQAPIRSSSSKIIFEKKKKIRNFNQNAEVKESEMRSKKIHSFPSGEPIEADIIG